MKKVKYIDPLLKETFEKIPPQINFETEYSFAIAATISKILKEKGLTQSVFAKMIQKNESEVSKWLSGTHNFTLQTLAKISATLGVDVLCKAFEKQILDSTQQSLFHEFAEKTLFNLSNIQHSIDSLLQKPILAKRQGIEQVAGANPQREK